MSESAQFSVESLPEYDLLLVGDGSGCTIDKPCGWFVTAQYPDRVERYYGGTCGGTNHYAELSPYLYALWRYHTEKFGNAGDTPKPDNKVAVTIVSDSEVTVKCGNRQYERRANASLWAQLEWFERNNYTITWVHVRRNSNELCKLADKMANLARKKMCEVN